MRSLKIAEDRYIIPFNNKYFVYGGDYYKLIVYAIPYYNGKYNENNRLVLYEKTGLKTESYEVSGGVKYDTSIPMLEEATYELGNTLISGISGNNYYISVQHKVTDYYNVMD